MLPAPSSGGRGKSYLTKSIIAKELHLRFTPCMSSFTGIAAICVPLGRRATRLGLQLDTSAPAPSSTTCSAPGRHLAAGWPRSTRLMDTVNDWCWTGLSAAGSETTHEVDKIDKISMADR